MAWTEVKDDGGQNFNPVWPYKDLGVGAVLEGEYTERRSITTKEGKKFLIHAVKAGETVTDVVGTTVLNALLLKVSFGAQVRIEYTGIKEGKSYHTFKVYVGNYDVAESEYSAPSN